VSQPPCDRLPVVENERRRFAPETASMKAQPAARRGTASGVVSKLLRLWLHGASTVRRVGVWARFPCMPMEKRPGLMQKVHPSPAPTTVCRSMMRGRPVGLALPPASIRREPFLTDAVRQRLHARRPPNPPSRPPRDRLPDVVLWRERRP